MTAGLFDNIVWHTLTGPHAAYATGDDNVRRYVPGFPPVVAFRDLGHPDFDALSRWVEPGECVHCDGWDGPAPRGWHIESECGLIRMEWRGEMPPDALQAVPVVLDHGSADAALDLATRTQPGPFTRRALELGKYLGIFDGPHLIAMAGARTCAGGFSEITAVCTHPHYRGRGLARQLVHQLLKDRIQRGEMPFLRVMVDNEEACALYRRMGFIDCARSIARTIRRAPLPVARSPTDGREALAAS